MAGSSTWSTGVDTTESLLPFRHGDLAERAELKEEILNLIRPHRDADVKPPFSGTGMATMALICCDNLTMKESQVLNWIISTFVFYSRKLIDAHSKAAVLDGPGGSDDPYHPFGCVVDNFWEILTDYEAPFLTKTKDRKVYGDYPTTLLSADHRASRIFFSKYLAPERKGVFPFLELPAEMRNTIYELCFQLPRAGVMVERERRFFASDRHPFMLEDVEENCSTDWPVSKDKDPEELFAIDTSKLLSLLLTCKQIHKEAEAILFAINDFYIRDITRFYEISVLLSHSRFHNMQSLFLNFTNFYQDRRDFAHWISVTEMLAARPKPLKLFILQMQDSDWTEISPDNRSAMVDKKSVRRVGDLDGTPGFKNLAIAAFKAEKLELKCGEYECDKIRAFIEERMAMLKSGEIQTGLEKRPVKRAKKSSACNEGKQNAGLVKKTKT